MRNASLLILTLILRSSLSAAAQTSCPAVFVGGQPPMLSNPKLGVQTRELCFHNFAVLHSGITRTPVWSAEHLTRESVKAARSVGRVNAFHPEERLPQDQRAELSDYARSGFDRGHMSPSGDMPDEVSQAESFSLANMVPQVSQLNRGVWEGIESAVRQLAETDGDAYVVTGPIFQGSHLQALKGRVLVPTSTYKAVYDPNRGWAGAYVCTNTDEPVCRTISVARLQRESGVEVFPTLPEATTAVAAPLPKPTPHGHNTSRRLRHIQLD